MRDINRIPKILDLINYIWSKQPDIRFNQLINNLQYEYSQRVGYPFKEFWEKDEHNNILTYRKVEVVDLFNLEDDYFMLFLKNKVKEIDKDEY